MKTVFLDSVGLVAMWEKKDQWHLAAMQAMTTLTQPPFRLVTTSYVLLECGNAASRRPYRDEIARLYRLMLSDGRLIIPTAADADEAWGNYSRQPPGSAGIVDHVSFVVMRRLGVTDVFTNDRHFHAAGFNPLF